MRRRLYRLARWLLPVALLLVEVAGGSAGVPSPEEFFGFRLGSDRQLVDYGQLLAYFRVLAQSSPCLQLRNVGLTTEGRPFVVAVISAPANLERQAHLRMLQARLADARVTTPQEAQSLKAEARVVVSINCSIHPTEVGASQMAPELAYELLTEQSPRADLVRREVILLLIPAHNPDGLDLVAEWYREHLGTPSEGSSPPFLYHRYSGHDLNRDWFMLTQAETRLTVDSVYNAWRPHVVVDMHQMGSKGARLFLPPYVDPIDPRVDPILQGAMSMLGAHVAWQLTGQGSAGVIMNSWFDAWTPARAYPNYHGGIRFLTEAASCRLATPVEVSRQELASHPEEELLVRRWNFPLPWPGGNWSLRHIVEYDKAVAWAVLEHAARNRTLWLDNAYRVAQNALRLQDEVVAFVVPPDQHDPPAVLEMLQTLRRGLVEVYEAPREVAIGGRRYPAGTFLIPLAQPYGGYARTLLEPCRYQVPRVHPQAPPAEPYDVTAHQLPLLMGVKVEPTVGPMPPAAELREASLAPRGGIRGGRPAALYLLPPHTGSRAVANLVMRAGGRVSWAHRPFVAAGASWPAGTFILQEVADWQAVDSLARQVGLELMPVEALPKAKVQVLAPPTIGVYQSLVATADEGWLRWVLERGGFSYRVVGNAEIQKGDLAPCFDVLVLPSLAERSLVAGWSEERYPRPYTGGLGKEGVEGLRRFVTEGGTLIALGAACELPLRHFSLPVENVLHGQGGQGFHCPGSLVRIRCDVGHPLCYGMPEEGAAFVTEQIAFESTIGQAPICFPADSLLLSGWLEGEKLIAHRAAVVVCPLGEGRVILCAFRPHFRAWTVGTFKVLFNALYWGATRPS